MASDLDRTHVPRPPPPIPLVGREGELALLEEIIKGGGPSLTWVVGPAGTGKSAVLERGLARHPGALHFRAVPLPGDALTHDFETLLALRLGEVPEARRPGAVPLGSRGGRWHALLLGLAEWVESRAEPFVLALDGVEALRAGGGGFGDALAELGRQMAGRELPLTLLLASRGEPDEELSEILPSTETIRLGPLPIRAAGWGHGATTPTDAFRYWTVFGDHAAHLRAGPPELSKAVRHRILAPDGDLHDAPLLQLERAFQRPARYVSILRALACGPREWAEVLESAEGIDTGGQLAPYLRRLEEEGFVRVELPLDAPPGSRRRRYAAGDPFLAFWFEFVLPNRSLLAAWGAERVWRERIAPRLDEHYARWLPEAARRWLRLHAEEGYGAVAREAGALWGGEAAFDAVAWLANGRICYGLARWSSEPVSGAQLHDDMAHRMKETRYGIGREARGPLYILPGGSDEELRRHVARDPLARVVGLAELMGER